MNIELHYRKVDVAIVAPIDFLSEVRIIDHFKFSETLIDSGYNAAQRVFKDQFGKLP